MSRTHRRCVFILLLIALVGVSCGQPEEGPRTPTSVPTVEVAEEKTLRLFFVRTYSEEDPWSNRIRTGLLERLAQFGYGQTSEDLVFSEFALGVEMLQDTAELENQVAAALQEIEVFDPDVVVVADDEAARQVIRGYPDPTQSFVFCGLNDSAWEYGLSRPNVVGVLEATYPLQTVHLAGAMSDRDPDKVLFLGDTSIASTAQAEEMRTALQGEENAIIGELRTHHLDDWETWQVFVLEQADAYDMLVLGYLKHLKNDYGVHIPERTVLRWTLENSPVPVFGLQLNTNDGGAVGGLSVSGYAQGQEAAELALEIFRGAEPATLPYRVPEHNVLVVNVVAARHWDLDVPLELLIGARIERNFPIALGGE